MENYKTYRKENILFDVGLILNINYSLSIRHEEKNA